MLQHIAELAAGKDIDANHVNVLLLSARQPEFNTEWQKQQALGKQTNPTALKTYEILNRQAAAFLARSDSAGA